MDSRQSLRRPGGIPPPDPVLSSRPKARSSRFSAKCENVTKAKRAGARCPIQPGEATCKFSSRDTLVLYSPSAEMLRRQGLRRSFRPSRGNRITLYPSPFLSGSARSKKKKKLREARSKASPSCFVRACRSVGLGLCVCALEFPTSSARSVEIWRHLVTKLRHCRCWSGKRAGFFPVSSWDWLALPSEASPFWSPWERLASDDVTFILGSGSRIPETVAWLYCCFIE